MINEMAKYIPNRRKRKLHIGLFGYPRSMKGITLPRVIPFAAALYSVGLPPEILGLNALTKDDIEFIKSVYVGCKEDIGDALQYLNPDTPYLTKELARTIKEFPVDFEVNQQHKEITNNVLKSLQGDKVWLEEMVLRAANIRRFLG
jgi:phosphoenolpyruvate carboxylase